MKKKNFTEVIEDKIDSTKRTISAYKNMLTERELKLLQDALENFVELRNMQI